MNRFGTVRDAKEYLIRRILEQADRDGVVLSDVERKMLYFSESGWTLPNMMEISQEFDQAYDQDEYEKKIAQVIRRVRHQRNESGDDKWDDAVQLLRCEDHYLLVLIDGVSASTAKLSRREITGVILGSVVIVAVLLPFSFFVFSNVDNPFLQKLIIVAAIMGLAVLVTLIGNRASRKSA